MSSVSVIIPTWNRAATIESAIRSALRQTMSPLEVLVCDDGSTDGTAEIVAAIADPRVHWLPGPRGGRPAIPRNRGIQASKGDWLAFLDSDDEWLLEKLELQLRLAQELKCDAACSNAWRRIPQKSIDDKHLAWPSDRLSFDDFLEANRVVCSSAMISRSVLAVVGGFPEDPLVRAGEDYALWLRVATQTNFAYLAEPLVVYHDDPATSVRADTAGLIGLDLRVFDNFISWLQIQHDRFDRDSAYASKAGSARRRLARRIARGRCLSRLKKLVLGWRGRQLFGKTRS